MRVDLRLSTGGFLAVRAALLRSWLRRLGAFLLAGGDGRGRAVPVPVAVAVPVAVPVGLYRDALGDDTVEARPHPAQRAPGSRRRDLVGVRRRAGERGRAAPAVLQHGPLVLVHRLGQLDVLTAGQLPDDAGLHA